MSISALIEVEIATDTNANVLFAPLNEVLRGRWSPASKALRGMTSAAGMNQMPELPGMRIELNTAEKSYRVYDPLSLPENAELLEEASRVVQGVFSVGGKPAAEQGRKLTDDEFKTMLVAVSRLHEGRKVRVLKGEVPTVDEIKETVRGRTRKSFFDTAPDPEKIWEEDTGKTETGGRSTRRVSVSGESAT